jgi:hypothetical protein
VLVSALVPFIVIVARVQQLLSATGLAAACALLMGAAHWLFWL